MNDDLPAPAINGRDHTIKAHSIGESLYLADEIVVMTARPGRIKEIVRVDLPRPRERGSPEFLAIARTVERLVKEEVLKAGLV